MVIKIRESYDYDEYERIDDFDGDYDDFEEFDEYEDFDEDCHDMEEGIFSKKGNDASNDLKFKQSSIQVMKIGNALLQLASKANTTSDAQSLMSGLKDAKKEIDNVISDIK